MKIISSILLIVFFYTNGFAVEQKQITDKDRMREIMDLTDFEGTVITTYVKNDKEKSKTLDIYIVIFLLGITRTQHRSTKKHTQHWYVVFNIDT